MSENLPITILVVEDENITLKRMTRMLEKLGYGVKASSDPIDALRIFEDDPNFFNLVITDLKMPGMDGVELAKKIREYLKEIKEIPIPIIFATGNSYVDGLKGETVLAKPFTPEKLRGIVREVLDKAVTKE